MAKRKNKHKEQTADLLLEIGTEEIPSGYFKGVLGYLSGGRETGIRQLFESRNISFTSISCYTTPRRIILYIKGIPTYQDMVIVGPPKRIAYDRGGKPTKALEGFISKAEAAISDIEVYNDTKEERVRVVKRGVYNKDILQAMMPEIVRSLNFPKTMRWDSDETVFARPIRRLLGLFDSEVLSFCFGNLKSSNLTYGHRFLGRSNIAVKRPSEYFRQLDKNHVIWDHNARRQKILRSLQQKNWHENEQLLDEVNNLVEDPYLIEGSFKKEYLSLPKEVLLASMAKHQRVFCLEDKKGNLANRFVAVINGRYNGLRRIRKNNEFVLDARLKDALYFYNADIKRPLSEWAKGLEDVVFHKQLGSLGDKVRRIQDTASFLSEYIEISSGEEKALHRAISLCKADLLTQMVGEFPSLQGTMGRYYALRTSEPREVADAIGEHYLPRFAGDLLPRTKLGILCSLADKLDTIICYFKIGKFPKGNWDLYALRRQGIGVISILLEREYSLSLDKLFDYTFAKAPGDYERLRLRTIYTEFFKDRFTSLLKERHNYRHDLLDAVISSGTDDLSNSFLKLRCLDSIIRSQSFEDARCIIERTHNIIQGSKGNLPDLDEGLVCEDDEKILYTKFKELRDPFMHLVSQKSYAEATELFAKVLSRAVHNFFDKVMVNVDDKRVRGNRMSLLLSINKLYAAHIADLSKIVVTDG